MKTEIPPDKREHVLMAMMYALQVYDHLEAAAKHYREIEKQAARESKRVQGHRVCMDAVSKCAGEAASSMQVAHNCLKDVMAALGRIVK